MLTYSGTLTGAGRDVNQDSVYCSAEPVGPLDNLFIVADGMGGHKGGDIASQMCIRHVTEMIAASEDTSPVTMIREAIRDANRYLRGIAQKRPELSGMGTTMVLATLRDGFLCVANVGDSRLYLLHDGFLRQITEDHSLVEDMVKSGELTRQDARFHPRKNVITRAIGGDPEIEVDFFEVPVTQNDIVLLCSDGLSNMIDDRDLEQMLGRRQSLEEIGEALQKEARDSGGRDDISLVLLKL